MNENKKEESVRVASPSLSWLTYFLYDEYGEENVENNNSSLRHRIGDNEARELSKVFG
ncbi:hypothetical protein [Jeotgalibacillus marinus]|uniref:hypothetical protein n=1 Tax=Jeotgalibacillus marinus TaxID=86667 RepID=UPI003F5C1B3E